MTALADMQAGGGEEGGGGAGGLTKGLSVPILRRQRSRVPVW